MTQKVTNLEKVFRFRDKAFSSYMSLAYIEHVSPERLIDLSVEMTHDHPLLQYAAGWAAAESVMARSGDAAPGEAVFNSAALQIAAGLWRAAETGFTEYAESRHARHLADTLAGFRLRAQAAQASIPALQTAMQWRHNYQVAPQEVTQNLEKTRHGLLACTAGMLETLPSDCPAVKKVKYGVMREIASQILLQQYTPEFVVVPASVRQDNNVDPGLRADLMAVHTKSPHTETLIQVQGFKHAEEIYEYNSRRFMIYSMPELTLYWRVKHEQQTIDLMQALINQNEGRLEGRLEGRNAISQKLSDISQILGGSLLRFMRLDS